MDETDSTDSKTYLYVSFAMGTSYDMHILRILNTNLGDTMKIDWHYKLAKPSSSPAAYASKADQLFSDNGDST
jgi:hypothetical protein